MTRDSLARTSGMCDIGHERSGFCKCKTTTEGHQADYQLRYFPKCDVGNVIHTSFSINYVENGDLRNQTEKRSWPCKIGPLLSNCNILYFLYIICLLFSGCFADFNTCDFNGSGLDMDAAGVQPVYLSCTAGQITWQYPRAALRIIFKLPQPGGDFRGCIKASPKIEGSRLFVEGHRTLVPLVSADDDRPHDSVRCFTSFNGRVALYFEADPAVGGFNKQVASFEYDLEPLTSLYDPMEECRPCSDSELLNLYCSADFVAKGSITEAYDDRRHSRTVITFNAEKVFQQTASVFSASSKLSSRNEFNSETSNDLELSSSLSTGKLYVPMHCGAKAGPGQFLVLGTVRLGDPILKCAPMMDHWAKIVQKSKESAHCVLEL